MSTNKWVCTVCGYVHDGENPPEECPLCGAKSEFFELQKDNVPEKKEFDYSKKSWRCLICGYIHEGDEPPEKCPVCAAGADQFELISEEQDKGEFGGHEQKVIITGAGIAGLSAAEAVADTNPKAEITLFSKEDDLPYYRLNLTRYLAGEIGSDQLEIHDYKWYMDKGIKIMLNSELKNLDSSGKEIELKDGEKHKYDKLIITSGSHPFIPPVKGSEKENVFSLRTRKDADAIMKACENGGKVVCIGGGILGIETAGALNSKGVDVTLLESHDWILPRQLNEKGAELVEEHMKSLGITLLKNARTKELTGEGDVKSVLLADGRSVPADMVIFTTGVRPNTAAARLGGLNVSKGIVVDDKLLTSEPDIYAAGDVAEHRGMLYGIWGPSQIQGEIAGTNAAGGNQEFKGIPRAHMLKVLGYSLFSIGRIKSEDGSDIPVESRKDDKYLRFLFQDNRLVGSLIIGDAAITSKVKEVIEKGLDCSAMLRENLTADNVVECLGKM